MRIFTILALTAAVAGCGQTGSLYLPDKGVETPVEIRGPGQPPAPPAEEKKKEEKDDTAAQPPGR